MAYPLKIVTAEKMKFDGDAESMVARSETGDVCIMARHTNYMTPLTVGAVRVKSEGKWKTGSCGGGVLIVTEGKATIVADTFEWQEEIDVERAERAGKKAQSRLEEKGYSDFEYKLAETKLKKAINRIRIGKM